MSVDFDTIINNFLNARYGEDVRGSMVDMARAVESAINSQLLSVTSDLSDSDLNTASQAAVVGSMFAQTQIVGKAYENGTSADNLTENGLYFNNIIAAYPNGTIPDCPTIAGWLSVAKFTTSDILLQIYYPYSAQQLTMPFWRYKDTNGVWHGWAKFAEELNTEYENGSSADDLVSDGVYFNSILTQYPNGTIVDAPTPQGWLFVRKTGLNLVLQMYYPYAFASEPAKPVWRYRKTNQAWSTWYNYGESDVNYFLASTGDTTDRTSDIQTMLATGYCRLGAGDFYTTGITIPSNAKLEGCGNNTRLFLADSVTDGFAVKMGSSCCVANLLIAGKTTNYTPSQTVGTRHGMLFEGLADTNNGTVYRGIVNNVTITDFSGGGITCRNTGYSTEACLTVSDCYVYRCDAGINIPYFSEYGKFTNVTADYCYYGCICNGGNNMFANCAFNSNTVGIWMDNTSDQSPNNSHGSFVGCTINHSGSDSGIAIKLTGMKNGEVFSGCQSFYGRVEIADSAGIVFANCNFGNLTATVDGAGSNSGITLFTGCIFQSAPTITSTNDGIIHKSACYTKSGTAVN